MEFEDLTEKIIGAAYNVANVLGAGFLEKVYENAMIVELKSMNLEVENQYPLPVMYKGICVGDYFADLYVENEIIVELKAVSAVDKIHKQQLLNYLKACGKQVGLLINFGTSKITINRIINNF